MASQRHRPSLSPFVDGHDHLVLGGAHGSIQVRWREIGAHAWSVVPEPKLKASVRACYGAEFGRVTYYPAAHTCQGVVISRHGRHRAFSGPAYSAAEAGDALCKAIGDITFNPMWVEGFDTVLGPSDDLRPCGPSSPRLDDYALEWGDRLGGAIHEFRATRKTPGTVTARTADRHLRHQLERAIDVVKRRLIDVSTPAGGRVFHLIIDGRGLRKDAAAHDARARSMSAAEWSAVLTVTAILVMSVMPNPKGP